MTKKIVLGMIILAGVFLVAPRLSGCAVVQDVRGMVNSATTVLGKLPQQRVERKSTLPKLTFPKFSYH